MTNIDIKISPSSVKPSISSKSLKESVKPTEPNIIHKVPKDPLKPNRFERTELLSKPKNPIAKFESKRRDQFNSKISVSKIKRKCVQ